MKLTEIVEKLKQNQVVAYPTEAVFGLGCNPFSQSADFKTTSIRKRTDFSRTRVEVFIAVY